MCPGSVPPKGAPVSSVLDEHQGYLGDARRLGAFEKAIAEVVRPGDTVLDLASGTGILGLLACRAGARRVYSVEGGGIIGVARDLARANGFGDRITFIRALSLDATLPSRVDVIVGDQMGPLGIEAGLVEHFADARDRFLSPGGRIVPAGIDLCVAPVHSPVLRGRVAFWSSRPAGFDFTPIGRLAANSGYAEDIPPGDLLAQPVTLVSLDMATARPGPIRVSAVTRVTRAGDLDGIGGWFSARLSPSVVLSNSPLVADRIDRRNVVLPVETPVAVREGDEVRVAICMLPAVPIVTWRVAVGAAEAPPRASFTHSTWRGSLMSDEDLDRPARPGEAPVRNEGAGRTDAVVRNGALTLDSCVAISPDALDRRVGDRVVILDHATGSYFALDPVGSRMWELLLQTGRARAVLERMLREYEVPREQLAEDLLRVIGDLQARGLVEVVPCP